MIPQPLASTKNIVRSTVSNKVSKLISPIIRYLLAVSQFVQSQQRLIFAVIIRVWSAFKTGKTKTSRYRYIDR
eukprot:403363977